MDFHYLSAAIRFDGRVIALIVLITLPVDRINSLVKQFPFYGP